MHTRGSCGACFPAPFRLLEHSFVFVHVIARTNRLCVADGVNVGLDTILQSRARRHNASYIHRPREGKEEEEEEEEEEETEAEEEEEEEEKEEEEEEKESESERLKNGRCGTVRHGTLSRS